MQLNNPQGNPVSFLVSLTLAAFFSMVIYTKMQAKRYIIKIDTLKKDNPILKFSPLSATIPKISTNVPLYTVVDRL